jgi:hypothetical protein
MLFGSGTSAPPSNAQVLVALYGNVAQAYLRQLHLEHSRYMWLWLWDICTTCTYLIHGANYILEVQVYMHHLHLLWYPVPLQTCGSGISAPPPPDQVLAPATDMWFGVVWTTAPAQVPGQCFRDVAQGHWHLMDFIR